MDLKQCLTYLHCTQVTYVLVCKRLAHYYTPQQLSYYLKPLTPSVFILLCATKMFFLISLHLHYLVYCLPGYSQSTHLLELLSYSDDAHQKLAFNSFLMVPVSSQYSHYWLRYKLFMPFCQAYNSINNRSTKLKLVPLESIFEGFPNDIYTTQTLR